MKRRLTLLSDDELEEVRENPYELVRYYFKDNEGEPLELTEYQCEIVKRIIQKYPKRNLLWATTRAGKSFSVAIGIVLCAMMNPGEKIRVIGPTGSHANIIMSYVISKLGDHPDVMNSLSLGSGGHTTDRLRKELSRSRITFHNGSEISILTAGINNDGRQLLGWGGTIVIVDEAEAIPPELIRTMVMRMIGDEPEAMVLLIGNPIAKGYMWEHRDGELYPDWIDGQHIISWKDAVKEGRLSKSYIEERRRELTPQEFAIWYDAEYVEDTEDTLIPHSWIMNAIDNYGRVSGKVSYEAVGLDVARMGNDLTVLTHIQVVDEWVYLRAIKSWSKAETVETVNRVFQYMDKRKVRIINVDEGGVGGGVVDVLRERNPGGYTVRGINFGSKSKRRNLENMKAEIYMGLRKLFSEDLDRSTKMAIPRHERMIHQLNMLSMEVRDTGRIRILDNQTKSPDYADSLALACYHIEKPEISFGMVKPI